MNVNRFLKLSAEYEAELKELTNFVQAEQNAVHIFEQDKADFDNFAAVIRNVPWHKFAKMAFQEPAKQAFPPVRPRNGKEEDRMKRMTTLLLAALLALALAGCSQSADSQPSPYTQVNDLPQVELELLSADASSLSIAFVNEGEETVCAHGNFYLERLDDGAWVTMPYTDESFQDDPPFPSSYYEALPGGRSDGYGAESIPVGGWYGSSSLLDWEPKLADGTYRIIKPVYEASDPDTWHYLAGGFTLG